MESRIIDHPGAWRAADIAGLYDDAFTFEARHLKALDRALAGLREKGLVLDQITAENFPLDAIADDLAALYREVMDGRGIVFLRGLPVDRYDQEAIALIWFGLGAHFGTARSQSVLGDRLGHVINVGGKDRRERAYRNTVELTPHTDACDIIGMLCLQPAASGGISGYCSAMAIYNEIVANHPEHLEALYRGWPFHRFGEQAPGEQPVTPYNVPVFAWRDGVLSSRHLRAYVEMAAKETGRPLPDADVAALDCLDELACREDLLFETLLEPGEATFINNYTVLHTRTEFEDGADAAKRRHLLRLWLAVDEPRPMPDEIRSYAGRGIAPRKGRASYYTGPSLAPLRKRPGKRAAYTKEQ